MKNYTILNTNGKGRVELHDSLGLTGAEVSVNRLDANTNVPFVHSHKNNEEIYFILDGSGEFILDQEKVKLTKGDAVKVLPSVKRQLFAGNEGISYLCIQTKANSLQTFTQTDAVIE